MEGHYLFFFLFFFNFMVSNIFPHNNVSSMNYLALDDVPLTLGTNMDIDMLNETHVIDGQVLKWPIWITDKIKRSYSKN
jgi:hypothetical protein